MAVAVGHNHRLLVKLRKINLAYARLIGNIIIDMSVRHIYLLYISPVLSARGQLGNLVALYLNNAQGRILFHGYGVFTQEIGVPVAYAYYFSEGCPPLF